MCDRKALPARPRREHAGTPRRATAATRRQGRRTQALAGRGSLHEAGDVHHLRGGRRVSGRRRGAAQRSAEAASARRRSALRRRDAPPGRRGPCSSACTGRTASRSARPGCTREPAQHRARDAVRQGAACATTQRRIARDPLPHAPRGACRVCAALQTGRSAGRQHAAGCAAGSPRTLRRGAATQRRGAAALGRTLLGSMVQNGKFSAGMVHLVSTLKSVLLPTFGMPQMPILRCDEKRPKMGFSTTSSFFLGGILLRC